MKERKYKESYKLVTRFDDRGREKRVAIYTGDYYICDVSAKERRLFNIKQWAACAAFMLVFCVYLCLDTPGARIMYVMPVFACGIFPALYWIMGCAALMRTPEKMTIVQNETSFGRVLRSALGAAIFSAAAFIGDLVALIRGSAVFAQEYPGMVLLLLGLLCGGMGFIIARENNAKIKKIPADKNSAGEEKLPDDKIPGEKE